MHSLHAETSWQPGARGFTDGERSVLDLRRRV
jgi:hypothetical protein